MEYEVRDIGYDIWNNLYTRLYTKLHFDLEVDMKFQRGSRGITLLFL